MWSEFPWVSSRQDPYAPLVAPVDLTLPSQDLPDGAHAYATHGSHDHTQQHLDKVNQCQFLQAPVNNDIIREYNHNALLL